MNSISSFSKNYAVALDTNYEVTAETKTQSAAKASTREVVDGFDKNATVAGTAVKAEGGVVIPAGSSSGKKDIALWKAQEEAAYTKFKNAMPRAYQGAHNSCGTCSSAMALASLGLPFGDRQAFAYIDTAIRPWDLGAGTPTAPGDIVKFARNIGMQAQQYSKCGLEDIAEQLRDGRTVTVVMNYNHPGETGGSAGCHYVNVIGVKRNSAGEITDLQIRNPWGGYYADCTMSADEFMKQWTNVRANGQATGGIEDLLLAAPISDRTMIVMDKPEAKNLKVPNFVNSLGEYNANAVIGGVNGLAAGINAVKSGAIMAGVGQVTGSFVNTVVGGSCYIIGDLIGKNLEDGSDKLMDLGKEMLHGDWLQKIGGGAAIFFGAIGKAIGWLLNTMTNVISGLTELLMRILTTAGEKENARQSLKNAILESPEAAVRMQSASVETKTNLVRILLNDGHCSQDEQKAARKVLQASRERGDLAMLLKNLGGKEAILANTSGEEKKIVAQILA